MICCRLCRRARNDSSDNASGVQTWPCRPAPSYSAANKNRNVAVCGRTPARYRLSPHAGTHLPPTAEAGHPIPLAEVVEACLGELSRSHDCEGPRVEGVQAVLLSAHVGIVTCRSLVGHVLYTTRTKWAGGRRGGEAHVQIANWLFALVCWWVGNSRPGTRKLQVKAQN